MLVPHLRRLPGFLAIGTTAAIVATLGLRLAPAADEGTTPPSSHGGPDSLAFGDGGTRSTGIDGQSAGPASALPALAPTGTAYRSCVTDYGGIDWYADPTVVVAAHRAAATAACAADDWYLDTAFQNGILTFMLVVGEGQLAAAEPASEEPDELVASLVAQGFARLVTLEIASSGWCDEGEVQVALATLRDPVPAPTAAAAGPGAAGTGAGTGVIGSPTPGLAAIVAKAEAAGAEVEPGPALTVITGGDVPCATAIVHADGVVGWVTASDGATVRAAAARLDLS